MLDELKRLTANQPAFFGKDDWDCLVYAQHYGMATRLLDWTCNPLVALWFAAMDKKEYTSGFVYLLFVDQELILDKAKEKNPFSIGNTRVLKPNINNLRIAAQSGWFTAHRYSESSGKFVALQKNKDLKSLVQMREVPGDCKSTILESLNKLGINYSTIFPGMEGTCRHVNSIFGYPF